MCVRWQTDSPGNPRFNGILSLGSPPGRPKANCTPSGGSAVREATSAGVNLVFLTTSSKEHPMNRIVYLVGAVVIIIALLSFFGLR